MKLISGNFKVIFANNQRRKIKSPSMEDGTSHPSGAETRTNGEDFPNILEKIG